MIIFKKKPILYSILNMTEFIDDIENIKQYSDDEADESDKSTVSVSDSDTETETSEDMKTEELEEEPQPTAEELETQRKKDFITKVKVIAFDSLGKDPLTNGSTLNSNEKLKVVKKMEEVLTLSEDTITEIFNQIVSEKLFDNGRDYSTYPVYK